MLLEEEVALVVELNALGCNVGLGDKHGLRRSNVQLFRQLRSIDERHAALIAERERIVALLHRVRGALAPDHGDAEMRRFEPWPADVNGLPDASTRRIAGPDLRAAVRRVLRDADGAGLDIGQIRRRLVAHNIDASGRASQAISNALRADVASGRVARPRRGVYAWADVDGPTGP